MSGWVPVDACTLPSEQQPPRLAEFEALFRRSLRRADRHDPEWLRLVFDAAGGSYERARDLAARESACCSFFTFDVRRDAAEIVLDVRVPTGRAAVLDGLQRHAVGALGHLAGGDV